MDARAIGARIERARKRSGMTQTELGAIVGFSPSQMSAYEHGNVKDVTIETLEAIAHATETPVQEFLADMPSPQVTLAEVLRRDYPDMDAGTIETLRQMAAFLYAEHQKVVARKQGSARKGARVAPGTSGTTSTPGGSPTST